MITGFMVVAIVLLFILMSVALYVWGLFLDTHEHDHGLVRAVMVFLLSGATAVELSLSLFGLTPFWVTLLTVFVNTWGGLDAILRYPMVHDSESLFAMKQLLLVALKTAAYIACMILSVLDGRSGFVPFLAVLLLDVWGLPLLYLMAIPCDPFQQVVTDDAGDVDLAVRVWQLAICASERRRCLATCKGWWYRRLTAASERHPLARLAICVASPEHRRVLRMRGRSV